MDAYSRHLIFHASVILFLGLLYGAPYGRAINRGAPAHIVNSWRVAHQAVPIGATLMFAIATVLPSFAVSEQIKWLIAVLLIASSYAFAVSTPLAAITGHRGLTSKGQGLARLVYVGNMVGATTSLIASVLLIFAGFVSL